MLKKIAQECHVAISTVSTAFNHPEKISKSTRERIFTAAHELGYFTRKHKISTIGICTYGLEHAMWSEFYIHILEGLYQAAENQGIQIKFFSPKSILTYESIYDISGMIFLGKVAKETIQAVSNLKVPYLFCADPNIEFSAPAIYFDNQKGAFLATEYLISKGHSSIALILSDPSNQDFSCRERLIGHQLAIKKHGLEFSETNIFYGDYENFDLLETVLGQILRKSPQITAIFCESDVFAYKILAIAQKLGLQIPRDISLIGFDGISFPKLYFESEQILSTIETDMLDLGKQALNFMIEIIQKNEYKNKSIILPVKLLTGNTVSELKPYLTKVI